MLFGPLLGQQPLSTHVDGSTLVVNTRMSLNMLSLTLEQENIVLSSATRIRPQSVTEPLMSKWK